MPERYLGQTLGKYRIDAVIGSGGFAWVYKAFDPELEIPVALKILKPGLSFPLWLGARPRGRNIPIYNLFNYEQSDPALGWSVQKTRVRDFRGGDLSYDSHNGTDFAVAPGTEVCALATYTNLPEGSAAIEEGTLPAASMARPKRVRTPVAASMR